LVAMQRSEDSHVVAPLVQLLDHPRDVPRHPAEGLQLKRLFVVGDAHR